MVDVFDYGLISKVIGDRCMRSVNDASLVWHNGGSISKMNALKNIKALHNPHIGATSSSSSTTSRYP
jgi:hypothetical protein